MRFKTQLSFLALATLAGAVNTARAETPWAFRDMASIQSEAYRLHHKVPGLSVAVAIDNKIVFSRGYGFANLKDMKTVNEDTMFRLASVSKPITAVLAMELEQQGKLHRNHFARDYVKELPGLHTYRIWHLLSHQSGVRHYDGKNFDTDNQYDTMVKAIDRFKNDKLRFSPGQEYHYSTHGFTVLGAVIEKAAKERFATYLVRRRNAWGGMTHLQPDTMSQHDLVSRIYSKSDDGKVKEIGRDNTSWKLPGGGMMSNARDLAILGIKLSQGKILTQKALDTMWLGRDAKIEDSNYGLGWSVSTFGGTDSVSHSGAQNGAASYWRILPKKGIVVVVLSNMREHSVKNLANYLTSLALLKSGDKMPTLVLD